MRLAALFASAFAVFAFQCGGQVDEQCPSTSDQACVQDGKTCDFATTQCGQPSTETCTCKDGRFQCAQPGVCVIEECSTDTYPGSPCSRQGLQCEMMAMECSNIPTTCTCDGHAFQCEIADCPPPSCPPSDQITPGGACAMTSNTGCQGPNDAQCFCNGGTWACIIPLPDAGGPVDAGGSD